MRSIGIIGTLAITLGIGSAAIAQPRVGEPAPPIEIEEVFQAPEGASADFDSLEGQVVVLEFWATWCAPCIGAFPHLNELIEAFEGEPVTFIAVTMDDTREQAAALLEKKPLHAWIGLDTDGSVFRDYAIRRIPRTVVIDRTGVVRSISHPNKVSEETIRAALRNETPEAADAGASPAPTVSADEADAEAESRIIEVRIGKAASEGSMSMFDSDSIEIGGTTVEEVLPFITAAPSIARVIVDCDLPDERIDVAAHGPQSLGRDGLINLIRTALESAYAVEIIEETRAMEAAVLIAPNGPGPDLVARGEDGGWRGSSADGVLSAQNMQFERLIGAIEETLGVPVVNETGFEGRYDWSLLWTADDEASFIEALRDQLGIEVERRTAEVEVVVVRSK